MPDPAVYNKEYVGQYRPCGTQIGQDGSFGLFWQVSEGMCYGCPEGYRLKQEHIMTSGTDSFNFTGTCRQPYDTASQKTTERHCCERCPGGASSCPWQCPESICGPNRKGAGTSRYNPPTPTPTPKPKGEVCDFLGNRCEDGDGPGKWTGVGVPKGCGCQTNRTLEKNGFTTITCGTLSGIVSSYLIVNIGAEKAVLDAIVGKQAVKVGLCIDVINTILTAITTVLPTEYQEPIIALRSYKVEALLLASQVDPTRANEMLKKCGTSSAGQTVFDFLISYICSRIVFGKWDAGTTAYFNLIYSFSSAFVAILFDLIAEGCPVQCELKGQSGFYAGAGMCPDLFSLLCIS